jgi:hypothetical protein
MTDGFAEGAARYAAGVERQGGEAANPQVQLPIARPRFSPAPDPFPLPTEGPYAAAHVLVDAFVSEAVRLARVSLPDLAQLPSARPILDATPTRRAAVAVAAMQRVGWYLLRTDVPPSRNAADHLLNQVLALPVEFTVSEMADLLEVPAALPRGWSWLMLRSGALAHLERLWPAEGAADALRPVARELLGAIRADPSPDARPFAVRLFDLVTDGQGVYLEDDPWTDRLMAEVAEMEPSRAARWTLLLRFLQTATANRVSGRWTKQARAEAAVVGPGEFRARALAWLADVARDAPVHLPPRNADLARGLVWALAAQPDAEVTAALADAALACGRKIPGVGQRSPRLVNACVAALGEMPGLEALEQITRLRARIRYVQVQGVIEKTLLAAATRRGMLPADLEELAVSTHGMDEPGVLRDELDGWRVEVRLAGGKAGTIWTRDGRTQKSSPAALKEAHGDELRALKRAAAEMEHAFSAQRARLESIPLWERSLPYPAWRERYLDHPLLALLARRLVWRFETDGRAVAGAWLAGMLVDAEDRPLEGLGDQTRAGLWHPVASTPGEAQAWRGWLDRHGVTQPFKQAHRETYHLTPAELDTATHSNRFATHVLRQHQMAALARSRGWQVGLLGSYDAGTVPTLRVPGHGGLEAELRVDPIENRALGGPPVAPFVTTGWVRFYRDKVPVRLEEVPPLVLSEVMRDVDLFVGVSSIGADSAWTDETAFDGYWSQFAFGELSAAAETRREVLERLLPRLKIAPVVRLDGRFLEVRGTLNTYRIHLGSGNVLMEPGSRYLCVVPNFGADKPCVAAPALPFEGDTLLSVIISKAFLLSEDTRITDPTITRQLRTR